MSSRARLIVVLSVLFVGGLALSLWAAWFSGDWMGFWLNLGTELVGAVATYSLFELFIGRKERIESEKKKLIRQMGSHVKDIAVAAAEKLRDRGWLIDGSLEGANLFRANLEGADLAGADLAGADLVGADLVGADLVGADLVGVDLVGADLEGADLRRVDLEGADLGWANLFRANLFRANLMRANLEEANLGKANLNGATLPDGTEWTPDTDMARFTNSEHPDFWPSNDPHSLAYRGKDSD